MIRDASAGSTWVPAGAGLLQAPSERFLKLEVLSLSPQPCSLRRGTADHPALSVPVSLLADGGIDVPCPEMKIQLAMVRKTLPLEKSRPDSALSAKMCLTTHRLTLQVRAGSRRARDLHEHSCLEAARAGFVSLLSLLPLRFGPGFCKRGTLEAKAKVWRDLRRVVYTSALQSPHLFLSSVSPGATLQNTRF